MDLGLDNLQRLIYHKTQQTKPNQTKPKYVIDGKMSWNRCIDMKQKMISTS